MNSPSDKRTGWSRFLLATAVAGPPLALGGVHAWTTLGFGVVVLALWGRLTLRTKQSLSLPRGAPLALGVLVWATVLWLPVPTLQSAMAPGLSEFVTRALANTEVTSQTGIAISPPDAALEVGRLAGLGLLFVASAQISWRVVAGAVAAAGAAVALLTYGHVLTGTQAIYGLYVPDQIDLGQVPYVFGSFVNPNHQSAFLLLSIFATGALTVDARARAHATKDLDRARHQRDRVLAGVGALLIQISVLFLSLSRGGILSFLLFGPVGLFFGLRNTRGRSRDGKQTRGVSLSWAHVTVAVSIVGLVAVLLRTHAWNQLATLADLSRGGIDAEAKLVAIRDAVPLLFVTPATGLGPGSYADLSDSVSSIPDRAVLTHLESAPMGIVLTFGVVVGGLLITGVLLGWMLTFRYAGTRRSTAARRIVLLGLAAAGLQGCADHWWAFLGVAAPACALAGSLVPPGQRGFAPRRLLPLGGLPVVAALAVASTAPGKTWSERPRLNEEVVSGDRNPDLELARRPLDGRLHVRLARLAADAGHWEPALARAEVATWLTPGSIDAWLIQSAAADQLGDDRADASMARALELLPRRLPEGMGAHILRRYPAPAQLVALAPRDDTAWRTLVRAVAPLSAAHADALAARRTETHPEEVDPLLIRINAALDLQSPGLALHHARLLIAHSPHLSRGYLAAVRTLRAFTPPREQEARTLLEAALKSGSIADPAELGAVEERLVQSLARGTEADQAQARELLPTLLARPGNRRTRLRRARLRSALER